jgi:hypothetical protein
VEFVAARQLHKILLCLESLQTDGALLRITPGAPQDWERHNVLFGPSEAASIALMRQVEQEGTIALQTLRRQIMFEGRLTSRSILQGCLLHDNIQRAHLLDLAEDAPVPRGTVHPNNDIPCLY